MPKRKVLLPMICRLCQKSDEWYVNIFDANGTTGMMVYEVIQELVQIPIFLDDDLPTTVCEECFQKLTDFSDFKVTCIKSLIDFEDKRKEEAETHQETADEAVGDIDQMSSENDTGGHRAERTNSKGYHTRKKAQHQGCNPRQGDTEPRKESLHHRGTLMENQDENLRNINSNGRTRQGSRKKTSAPSPGHVGDGEVIDKRKNTRSKRNVARQLGESCRYCDKVFSDPNALSTHVETLHGVSVGSRNGGVTSDAKASGILMESSPGDVNLDGGDKQSDPVLDGKRTKRDAVASKKAVPLSKGKVVCEICRKEFTTRRSWTIHQRQHTGPFACEPCALRFPTEKKLISHQKKHEAVLLHPCDSCHERFRSKAALKLHAFTHLERIPECTICGKKFLTALGLTVHKNMHKRETLYQCPMCEEKFSRKSDLTEHMMYHPSSTHFLYES